MSDHKMECDKVKELYSHKIQFQPCCEECHKEEIVNPDEFIEIGYIEYHVCCAIERSINNWRKEIDRR